MVRQWLSCHTDEVAADNWVMFDNVVDPDWLDTKGKAILLRSGPGALDTFQKLVSQAFAEQSAGRAYIFTPNDVDPLTIPPSGGPTAWRRWEYPALTRNPRITEIISIDPRPQVQSDPALVRRVIWTPANGPSPNPPLGTNRNGPSP